MCAPNCCYPILLLPGALHTWAPASRCCQMLQQVPAQCSQKVAPPAMSSILDHSHILLALLQYVHAWLMGKPGSHFIPLCLIPHYGILLLWTGKKSSQIPPGGHQPLRTPLKPCGAPWVVRMGITPSTDRCWQLPAVTWLCQSIGSFTQSKPHTEYCTYKGYSIFFIPGLLPLYGQAPAWDPRRRQHCACLATGSSVSPGLGEARGPGRWQGAATGLFLGGGQGYVAAWGSPAPGS